MRKSVRVGNFAAAAAAVARTPLGVHGEMTDLEGQPAGGRA